MLIVAVLVIASPVSLASQVDAFDIVYVNDGADYMVRGMSADIDGLHRVVDSYADAGHRLLIYGVRSGVVTFNYRSRVPGEYLGEDFSDLFLKPFPRIRAMRDMLKSYFDRGIDPFGEIVRRAKQRRVRILAQIRPNNFNPTKGDRDRIGNGRFYYEHPEFLIEGSTQWDYGKEVVRNYFLDVFREILERYDVDGLDIDFTQQPPFFHDSEPRKKEIMNDFLRSVRAELDRAAAKRGKKMLFTAGIRLDPPGWHWRKAGLDLPTWSREGIMDLIAVYHLFGVDPVPGLDDLSEYVRMVEETDCRFYVAHAHLKRFDRAYPGLSGFAPTSHISQEYFAALERMTRAAGADGVLYRNYQIYPANKRISDPYQEYRSYNVSYTADSLPEETANRWSSNGEAVAMADGGLLLLQGARTYHRNPAFLNVGSQEITLQAEVKVISAENYRDCFLEVANGKRHVLLELFEGKVRLSDVGFSGFLETRLDLSRFRTLRLTLDREGLAQLYLDGGRQPLLQMQLRNLNPYWHVGFGQRAASAISEWDNLHYTLQGAFSPPERAFSKSP
jgi:hypothetical protein